MPIDISIIIISFNGIEFIDDCLNSAIKSIDEVSSEIIVVDNASHDGTIQLLENKYPNIKLIKNSKNLGFAAAVNIGLANAIGRFILLLNQDIKIIGPAIPQLTKRLTMSDKIGIIGPKFIGFDGKLQKSCRAFPKYMDLLYEFTGLSYIFPKSKIFSQWKMGWFDHERELEVDQPMGAAMMFRHELVDKIGIFDESFRIFFNDVDFCRRAKEAGFVNLYYPIAVIMHYGGGSINKMKPRMIFESHYSMFRYFKKYNKSIFSLPLLYFWGGKLFIAAIFRCIYHLIREKL